MTAYQPTQHVILCAKPDELRQVKKVLSERGYEPTLAEPSQESQQVYSLPSGSGSKTSLLVTTCVGMGHLSAALAVMGIVTRRSPRTIIFVGTAASLNPEMVQLGDVVVPNAAISRSYEKILEKGQPDYDKLIEKGGTIEQFFGDNILIAQLKIKEPHIDSLVRQSDIDIDRLLECGEMGTFVLGGKGFELRQPRILTDVDILSCGMVVNSLSYRDFLHDFAMVNSRKAEVIDMESYGFLAALEALKLVGVGHNCDGLVIRGISDYAGRKADTEKRPAKWKDVAVRNAARVAVELLERMAPN